MEIINSSGKKIGEITIDNSVIVINNYSKPVLIIDDSDAAQKINNKDESFICALYDDYTLTISEIASLYGIQYHKAAKLIKNLPVKSSCKSGRRNSSFSLTFSDDRLRKMSESQKGKPPTSTYERTPEIRNKISESLRSGYKDGRIIQDPVKKSKAWADGKYANAKMGRGIQGFFHSAKMNKDMYFRSLLELKYLIIIENDPSVISFDMEPFQITLPHKMHYTPDVFINNNTVVELKPSNLFRYTDGSRFCLEIACLNKYCNENNLGFVVVYDSDIDFESRSYRKYLKENPDIIEKYQIRFKKPL